LLLKKKTIKRPLEIDDRFIEIVLDKLSRCEFKVPGGRIIKCKIGGIR
jgi:hypothetical protein